MRRHVIVGIGEVLWDIFPEGAKFGGAPANFACSAAGLGGIGAEVFMVSGLGRDELGERALESLQELGVDTSYVSRNNHATGQVFVKLDSRGQASYEFARDTAWDNLLCSSELEEFAGRSDAVCFGTLGQRNNASLRAIRQFVSSTPARSLRIFDINLRPPFVDHSIIMESLALANILKLNDEELPIVSSLCGITGTTTEVMKQIASRFDLRAVALTCGEEGAFLLCGESLSQQPAALTEVIDTVGAGDAYAAALALGFLEGHTLDRINQHACKAASFVCSQAGATPKMPGQLQVC